MSSRQSRIEPDPAGTPRRGKNASSAALPLDALQCGADVRSGIRPASIRNSTKAPRLGRSEARAGIVGGKGPNLRGRFGEKLRTVRLVRANPIRDVTFSPFAVD